MVSPEKDEGGDILPFKGAGARLVRAPRRRTVADILALDHPEETIRGLAVDELHDVVHQSGLGEAAELLVHATGEQVQGLLDLDLWAQDQLSLDRLGAWVELLAEMPARVLVRWAHEIDVEVLALMLRKGCRVYELDRDTDPGDIETEGLPYRTPDSFFLIDIVGYEPDDPAEAAVVRKAMGGHVDRDTTVGALRQILETLYQGDLNFVRRILVGIKSELDSELEETAYRWRSGRLADLGFADYYDALEVYRELDPRSVRLGELAKGARLRPAHIVPLNAAPAAVRALDDSIRKDDSLLARALRLVTEPSQIEDLRYAFASLVNRALAADRVGPSEDDRIKECATRLRGTLDLALELLARGPDGRPSDERAAEALKTIALVRIHRLGFSLTAKVREAARELLQKGPFSAVPDLDLTEPEEQPLVDAVRAARPVFPRALDTPPADGTRPFSSLRDIAVASAALERVAAGQALLLGLGVRPSHLTAEALEAAGIEVKDRTALDAAQIGRTVLCQRLLALSHEDKLAIADEAPYSLGSDPSTLKLGLSPAELTELERRVEEARSRHPREESDDMKLPLPLRDQAQRILASASPGKLTNAIQALIDRWVASLTPLQPVLVKPTPPRNRRPGRRDR